MKQSLQLVGPDGSEETSHCPALAETHNNPATITTHMREYILSYTLVDRFSVC